MNSFVGGKTFKKRKYILPSNKKRKYHVPWKGWKNQSPNHSQRVTMRNNCGKKCFLGKRYSFPICNKNTCKISKKGVWSAYIRSQEFHNAPSRHKCYKKISSRAKQLLKKLS